MSLSGSIVAQDTSGRWIDSVYRSLPREQRIAQLFILRAWSYRDSTYNDSLTRIITTFNPGGVCFFKGGPVRQALLTNRLQQASPTPLLIATDAEWGPGMRLDSAFTFPRQMALGAMADDSLIYRMGRWIGRSCRRLGVHINFAPVVDVNNNPANPVIGFRSFGEDPKAVARKGFMYMKGLQDEGILATLKHFPGHGDTETDSHLALPLITHTAERLDSVELYPFRELIRKGAEGIMVAHLYMPGLDTTRNTPTTLSGPVITGLLREKLGFGGYIVTDALDMDGVAGKKDLKEKDRPRDVALKALMAGNDILLLPRDLGVAIREIATAVDSGRISDSLIEAKCRRVLALKYRMGLNRRPVVETRGLTEDLNAPEAAVLQEKMVKGSVTVLGNDLRAIPLTHIDRRKIALLCLGDTVPGRFGEVIGRADPVSIHCLPSRFSHRQSDSIYLEVSKADLVILSLHGIASNPADTFGLTGAMIRLTDTLILTNRTILTVFGTPYALGRIPGAVLAEAVVVAYQDNPTTREVAAEVIIGGVGARGRLPVTTGSFPRGAGVNTDKTRMEYILPEEIGIPREALTAIDTIVQSGLAARAFPGCQVLLAKDGKIFFEKAYGHPAYDDSTPVTTTDIYDLASVTKTDATTLAMMKLYEEGRIRLSDTLGRFLPFLRRTNKSGLIIADIMTHRAGLQEWIPFFKATLSNGKPDPRIYRTQPSDSFPVRVAENLWIRKDYPDTISLAIALSPLRSGHEYKYSDLGFYLLRLVTERLTGRPFDRWLDSIFYRPLGLTTMGFTPRDRFPLTRLMPTENDEEFRGQMLRGDVHDPGAAMLGGISGHAGLFSDACDLAVICQMLLWDGT
ncbi:MAG TPA: glycoside hydrolase family 3 N-terminal domain-containing protein, partial [Bacteroidales bacterium]|nr:glycoside hydrolase family 3 N-terminal domain-containing protein [Bacteroidales bacterium]